MTEPSLTLPTPNGTSREELLQQQIDAIEGVRHAMKMLGYAAPNARDYYTQDNTAYSKAQAEHVARMERMRQTIRELDAIAIHISDAPGQRRA